jgi:hypothetical protein
MKEGVILLTIFLANIALGAASEKMVLTWKTETWVPPFYLGKALPVGNSKVNIALLLLNKNKPVDLSKHKIRWYVNNQLRQSGLGIINFSLTAPFTSNQSLLVRAVVENYNDEEWNQFISIPVIRPEAVIDASQVNKLRPLAYFFNIDSAEKLKISWADNPQSTTLRVQNPDNPLETGQATISKNR